MAESVTPLSPKYKRTARVWPTAATSAVRVGKEGGTGIAVDRAGDAYVTGWTVSTETSFPVTVGPDVSANGGGDAFVAKVTTQEFPWPIFLPAILEGGKKE